MEDKKIQQYTVDKGWEQMRILLDKEMPQKRKRRGIFWIFLAGVSILILAYLTLPFINTIDNNIKENNNTYISDNQLTNEVSTSASVEKEEVVLSRETQENLGTPYPANPKQSDKRKLSKSETSTSSAVDTKTKAESESSSFPQVKKQISPITELAITKANSNPFIDDSHVEVTKMIPDQKTSELNKPKNDATLPVVSPSVTAVQAIEPDNPVEESNSSNLTQDKQSNIVPPAQSEEDKSNVTQVNKREDDQKLIENSRNTKEEVDRSAVTVIQVPTLNVEAPASSREKAVSMPTLQVVSNSSFRLGLYASLLSINARDNLGYDAGIFMRKNGGAFSITWDIGYQQTPYNDAIISEQRLVSSIESNEREAVIVGETLDTFVYDIRLRSASWLSTSLQLGGRIGPKTHMFLGPEISYMLSAQEDRNDIIGPSLDDKTSTEVNFLVENNILNKVNYGLIGGIEYAMNRNISIYGTYRMGFKGLLNPIDRISSEIDTSVFDDVGSTDTSSGADGPDGPSGPNGPAGPAGTAGDPEGTPEEVIEPNIFVDQSSVTQPAIKLTYLKLGLRYRF